MLGRGRAEPVAADQCGVGIVVPEETVGDAGAPYGAPAVRPVFYLLSTGDDSPQRRLGTIGDPVGIVCAPV